MSNTTDVAARLLEAITIAQSVLVDLNPAQHSEEKDILKQLVLRMRGVYARLLKDLNSLPGSG